MCQKKKNDDGGGGIVVDTGIAKIIVSDPHWVVVNATELHHRSAIRDDVHSLLCLAPCVCLE
jgi:hypothetical protein